KTRNSDSACFTWWSHACRLAANLILGEATRDVPNSMDYQFYNRRRYCVLSTVALDNEARANRFRSGPPDQKHDWDRRGRRLCSKTRQRAAAGNDHRNLAAHQIGGEGRSPLVAVRGSAPASAGYRAAISCSVQVSRTPA